MLFPLTLTVIGLDYTLEKRMGHMYLDVCLFAESFASLLIFIVDDEFTQLMKGLQGERLRQAFHYLDKDEDGFIRPEEFKRIILVRVATNSTNSGGHILVPLHCRKLLAINYQTPCHRQVAHSLHLESGTAYILFRSRRIP
jgi:hypothetical protein